MISNLHNKSSAKKPWRLPSLLLVLMTAACGSQAQQYFDKADTFFDSGEYQNAIDNYSEASRKLHYASETL